MVRRRTEGASETDDKVFCRLHLVTHLGVHRRWRLQQQSIHADAEYEDSPGRETESSCKPMRDAKKKRDRQRTKGGGW
jgi:hypothetical protein